MPITLAAIFPVNICSLIYIALWVICAIIFARLFTVSHQNDITNQRLIQVGASLMIISYLIKALNLALQVRTFGSLDMWNGMDITSILFGWIGLVILFYNLKMGLTGVVFMLSGLTMTIPYLLSSLGSMGVIEWNTYSLLVPASSLVYLIGFIISIVLCIRWIKKV